VKEGNHKLAYIFEQGHTDGRKLCRCGRTNILEARILTGFPGSAFIRAINSQEEGAGHIFGSLATH
jgi:hypothetical protein